MSNTTWVLLFLVIPALLLWSIAAVGIVGVAALVGYELWLLTHSDSISGRGAP